MPKVEYLDFRRLALGMLLVTSFDLLLFGAPGAGVRGQGVVSDGTPYVPPRTLGMYIQHMPTVQGLLEQKVTQ